MQLNVAAYAVEKGNLEEAERLYADALKKSVARFGRDDMYTATAMLGLGAVSCRLGRDRPLFFLRHRTGGAGSG
jgi:hypothetical protein